MGFYPYTQKCENGHEWGAVFISVSPMSDSGRDTCPECGAATLPRPPIEPLKGMEESPINFSELNLRQVPKGTPVICYVCGSLTQTGVDMLVAAHEVMVCPKCSKK